MSKKSLFFCVLALFFTYSLSAVETPEMVAVDISGTSLQPYYLSTVEVTQKLYQEVTGRNPSSCVQETAAFSKMLAGEVQENRPVETLSFFDAMQFCNLLTEQTLGKDQCVYTLTDAVYDETGSIIRFGDVKADFTRAGYRLPTREEWLNAAGMEPASLAMYSWNVDNSAARGEGRTGFGTHAVGKKLANAEGLYDMFGNVAEMCHEGETLNLGIAGTAWNRLEDAYADGYTVDWLYGYSQFTVSRNNVRESFTGTSTCGFRLCRSITDLPFTLTGISVPDVCDSYDGIVPVTITGSGFFSRRTEPLTVRVEGFASKINGSVQWLSDEKAIVPVQAEALKIQGEQRTSLRVIVKTSYAVAKVEGSLTRIHTEIPLHPADILLDDGTVLEYNADHVFSGYEKEHAAALIIYAPYDGTEVLALGLSCFDPLSSADSLEQFLSGYGEKTGIFGAYLGSGWYVPSEKELAPLSDPAFRGRVEQVLAGLGASSAAAFGAEGKNLITTDGTAAEGVVVPVKDINYRALITQKYEYLTANNLLRAAAEQDAILAAQMAAEEEAAEKAAREAAEKAEAERIEREKAEAEAAALAEQEALAAQAAADAEAAAAEDLADESAESDRKKKEMSFSQDEARTLIGFGCDVFELKEPVQTLYAELSTGLVIPYLFLSAEGNFTLGINSKTNVIPYIDYPFTTYSLVMPYWDAALSLGLSVRLKLGFFHPDLFVSAGALTNMQLIEDGRYVNARLEAGLDIPLFKRLTLTARYSADLDKLNLDSLMKNYRLTAGFSWSFPSFILF